jgi:hypothetical protein
VVDCDVRWRKRRDVLDVDVQPLATNDAQTVQARR